MLPKPVLEASVLPPMSSVTFSTYYVKSRMRITEQSKASICVYKAYTFCIYKTFNHSLVSFIALWSCTETVILTFNRLESIETVFECVLLFYFHFWDSRSYGLWIIWIRSSRTIYFTRLDVCQWCSVTNQSPLSSSVTSPYSVYVVSELSCTLM